MTPLDPHYYLFLFIPVLIITYLLIKHSLTYRSTLFTLMFFIGGFAFFFAREAVNLHVMPSQYQHKFSPFNIWDVPIGGLLGWLIVCYLSLCFAEAVTDEIPLWRHRLFPMLTVNVLTAAAMSFAIEASGIPMGWWRWGCAERLYGADPFKQYLHGVPFIAFYGWSMTQFIFISTLIVFFYSDIKYRENRLAGLALYLLIIGLIVFFGNEWPMKILFLALAILVLFHPARYRTE